MWPCGFELKQDAARSQAGVQFGRTRGNSWLGTWNSEALANTPSKRRRQIELKKILLADLAAGMGARHRDEMGRAVQAHGVVPELGKHLRSRPGPQPKSRMV